MKLVEAKGRNPRRIRKVQKHLNEFIASNFRTAEILGWEEEYDGNYELAYNSFYQSARQNRRISKMVRVTRWNGHIYLERIDLGGGAE